VFTTRRYTNPPLPYLTTSYITGSFFCQTGELNSLDQQTAGAPRRSALTLKTFSKTSIHIVIIYGKFYWNLPTKYRSTTAARTADGWTADPNTPCLSLTLVGSWNIKCFLLALIIRNQC